MSNTENRTLSQYKKREVGQGREKQEGKEGKEREDHLLALISRKPLTLCNIFSSKYLHCPKLEHLHRRHSFCFWNSQPPFPTTLDLVFEKLLLGGVLGRNTHPSLGKEEQNSSRSVSGQQEADTWTEFCKLVINFSNQFGS